MKPRRKTTPSLVDPFAGMHKRNHSLNERSEMIDITPWALDFNWDEIVTIANFMESYTVQQDRRIFHEGDKMPYFALIIRGQVRIQKYDSHNREQVITILGPGKAIGEMSLIDGMPRSASAIARETSLLLVMTLEKFSKLTEVDPSLAMKIVMRIAKLMSLRLRQTSGRLIEYIGSNPAPE